MPLLSISVFLPLLGGVLLMALPNKSARIAHGVSIATTGLTFVVTLAIWARGTLPGGFAQVEEIAWIPAIGAAYRLGIDGLSLPLILLTSLLFFLSAIYAARITDRPAVFVALMLMLETASI
ncbi:MAG: NADH-quinone oxidoreductase subunit M, partial [Alphaproteobacteria bacterium]|nr:NADH-quinone oxidoreductase subunit M [Alphaproteobacteria bacterium]